MNGRRDKGEKSCADKESAIGAEDYYTAEAESRQPITGSVIESTGFPQSNEAQLDLWTRRWRMPKLFRRWFRGKSGPTSCVNLSTSSSLTRSLVSETSVPTPGKPSQSFVS